MWVCALAGSLARHRSARSSTLGRVSVYGAPDLHFDDCAVSCHILRPADFANHCNVTPHKFLHAEYSSPDKSVVECFGVLVKPVH